MRSAVRIPCISGCPAGLLLVRGSPGSLAPLRGRLCPDERERHCPGMPQGPWELGGPSSLGAWCLSELSAPASDHEVLLLNTLLIPPDIGESYPSPSPRA